MPFFFVTVIPLKYADTATHWTNKNRFDTARVKALLD